MEEKKKQLPKYRLNYLMGRIEEIAKQKILSIRQEACEEKEETLDRIPQVPDYKPLETLERMMNSAFKGNCNGNDVKAAIRKIKARNRKYAKRIEQGNWTNSGNKIQLSTDSVLRELTGWAEAKRAHHKETQKVYDSVEKKKNKRINKIRDFVQNTKDEYYLGKDIDLVQLLEDFEKRSF